MSHDHGLKCQRCGAWLALSESANGGLCHSCLDKAALDDDEKRPPEPATRGSRGDVLLRAHAVINGQRQDQYGRPEDCFSTIAALWSVWLGRAVTPQDVAMCMALLKIARMRHGAGTEDNAVDCCGYIALAEDMRRADA